MKILLPILALLFLAHPAAAWLDCSFEKAKTPSYERILQTSSTSNYIFLGRVTKVQSLETLLNKAKKMSGIRSSDDFNYVITFDVVHQWKGPLKKSIKVIDHSYRKGEDKAPLFKEEEIYIVYTKANNENELLVSLPACDDASYSHLSSEEKKMDKLTQKEIWTDSSLNILDEIFKKN